MKKFSNTSITEKASFCVITVLVFTLAFNVVAGKVSLLSPAFADEDSSSGDSMDSGASTDDVDEEDSTNEESLDEKSTPSLFKEESTVSEEVSVVSEESTQETSVHSGANIEAFDNVENLGQDIAVVTIKQKLFFLIPVDIDQTVELDEEGNVLSVRQTILNMILDWLSF